MRKLKIQKQKDNEVIKEVEEIKKAGVKVLRRDELVDRRRLGS